MPYGPEVHSGFISYEAVVQHNPSTIRLNIMVNMSRADGTVPPEATRDQVFQAFLNKLNELANTTLVSSTKYGNFTAMVTPG